MILDIMEGIDVIKASRWMSKLSGSYYHHSMLFKDPLWDFLLTFFISLLFLLLWSIHISYFLFIILILVFYLLVLWPLAFCDSLALLFGGLEPGYLDTFPVSLCFLKALLPSPLVACFFPPSSIHYSYKIATTILKVWSLLFGLLVICFMIVKGVVLKLPH